MISFLPRAYVGARYWIYNLYHPCKKLITIVGGSLFKLYPEVLDPVFGKGSVFPYKMLICKRGHRWVILWFVFISRN